MYLKNWTEVGHFCIITILTLDIKFNREREKEREFQLEALILIQFELL